MGLFGPDWKSKDTLKAIRAVEKITDQDLLKKVALEAPDGTVRAVAVAIIQDQDFSLSLLRLPCANPPAYAVGAQLTDQKLIFEAVRNEKLYGCKARGLLVSKLTDEAELEHVALHDTDAGVRKAAVARLTGAAALERLIDREKDCAVLRAAVRRLSNAEILLRIARRTSSGAVLEEIQKMRAHGEAGYIAVAAEREKQLAVERELNEVAQGVYGDKNRRLHGITDTFARNEIMLAALTIARPLSEATLLFAVDSVDLQGNMAAIFQEKLAKIALAEQRAFLAVKIAEKLLDTDLLTSVAEKAACHEAREAARKKLAAE